MPTESFLDQVWRTIQRHTKALIHSPLLRVVAGLGISAFALTIMARTVNLAQVWSSLSNLSFLWASLVIVCVLFNQVAKTLRWRLLIGQPGEQIPTITLFKAVMVGQLLNLVFPARIGDLIRAYKIGGLGPGRAYVLGTVVIEKILDFLIYLSLFVVLLVLIPLPEWLNQPVFSIVFIVFCMTVALVIILFRRDWILKLVSWFEEFTPLALRRYTTIPLRAGLASLDILKNRNSMLKVGAWSAIIWITALGNNYLTLQALGIELPLEASLFVLISILAGISVPAAPGSIGVFELICVLTLGTYGVSPSQALSYGLVLHFLVVIPILILGLISMWSLGLSKEKITEVRTIPEGMPTIPAGSDGDA